MTKNNLRRLLVIITIIIFILIIFSELTLAAEKNNNISRSFWDRFNVLVAVVLIFGFVIWYLYHAGRGKELYIRPISGLSVLDEAVGRATEMGKSVLYIPGLWDVDDIQTLASLSILGYVAQKTAEYETDILVPNNKSVVMAMAQEIVKESYLKAGHPDAFKKDSVFYLTDDQFGYTAGVDGIMLRDKPAVNFFIGYFFAESLILAETGFSTGAIQIAGTASVSQLPFFVVACDYTLIGEELYAASAYLSKDPHQVSSLKGQDLGKVLILASITVGSLCCTLSCFYPKLSNFLKWFAVQN